jgi:Ku70/Ku80-like protein
MPRASWKGFLRLSLVSCPVYLSPATTRTTSIRLNQVWVPRARPAEPVEREENQEDVAPISRGRGVSQGAAELAAEAEEEPEYAAPATRIALRPHDPHTGEEIDRDEVRKGYEYERGQFVTFTPEELKALDVESSHTIDLTTFVPCRGRSAVLQRALLRVSRRHRCRRDLSDDQRRDGGSRDGRFRTAHAQPTRAHGAGRTTGPGSRADHAARRRGSPGS